MMIETRLQAVLGQMVFQTIALEQTVEDLRAQLAQLSAKNEELEAKLKAKNDADHA